MKISRPDCSNQLSWKNPLRENLTAAKTSSTKHKFRGKNTFTASLAEQTTITRGRSIATELEKQFSNAYQRFAEPEATGEAATAPSQAPWRPEEACRANQPTGTRKSIAVGSLQVGKHVQTHPKKPTKVEATLVASYTTHSQPFRCVSFPSVEQGSDIRFSQNQMSRFGLERSWKFNLINFQVFLNFDVSSKFGHKS